MTGHALRSRERHVQKGAKPVNGPVLAESMRSQKPKNDSANLGIGVIGVFGIAPAELKRLGRQ